MTRYASLGLFALSACFGLGCGTDDGGEVLSLDLGAAEDAGIPDGADVGPVDPGCLGKTFTDVYSVLSSGSCAFAGCHGGSSPSAGLDLSASMAEVHAALVGVAPTDTTVSGTFPARVVAGSADTSFLIHKMDEETPMGAGIGKMPPSGLLPECERYDIRAWIDLGAPLD